MKKRDKITPQPYDLRLYSVKKPECADPTTASFFFDMGMHCLGCPSARGESIEEACEVHGVDADELVKKLNAHVAGK